VRGLQGGVGACVTCTVAAMDPPVRSAIGHPWNVTARGEEHRRTIVYKTKQNTVLQYDFSIPATNAWNGGTRADACERGHTNKPATKQTIVEEQ
jgi:hypothetical protein